MSNDQAIPEVTLSEAQKIITEVASFQSVMLLSSPGVGKSQAVYDAARSAGLECKSLLGTQIAPEDVSGVPKLVGERSVFCPPRALLPEVMDKPFCLFLDELPACSPDVQKAFYSLLLDRRIGEFDLPKGSWVVAAGNRVEDHALVRNTSSALVNRVLVLRVKVSVIDWINYARKENVNGRKKQKVRDDIISYILYRPQALQREVPMTSVPFSTPRSWEALSKTVDKLEQSGVLNDSILKATAFGMVSPEDAAIYISFLDSKILLQHGIRDYIRNPELLPKGNENSSVSTRFFILRTLREAVQASMEGDVPELLRDLPKDCLDHFLDHLIMEDRIILILDLAEGWAKLGAEKALVRTLAEITKTGLEYDGK